VTINNKTALVDDCDMAAFALRKRPYYIAKQPLSAADMAAFVMQDNPHLKTLFMDVRKIIVFLLSQITLTCVL